jgi:hypothetical protein
MASIRHPFYPIIYVRGYAMTQAEIDATVSTPYMGFNLGATKIRQDWRGNTIRHIFESPLVRLIKDYGYQDNYSQGKERTQDLPAKSVVIYRYYEQADTELGGEDAPSIEEAAIGLSELVLNVRDQVCATDPAARRAFKVYLVAHSMGGLVCRCFLQNPAVGTEEAKSLVDKVFTYATPHNGIDFVGMNVPEFLRVWDVSNFNRARMAEYLALPQKPKRVDSLNGKFDSDRFFCLVGTDNKDYAVARGLSRRLAGEMSDGLVKIENASVRGAPRAFVYRSHSGPYGIVNSEEGYQNLTRFLFGDLRVDGVLEVETLPLPPSVRKAQENGKQIRASYFFESTVMPRGAMTYKLTERRKETFSAILRPFDELLRLKKVPGLETPRSPFLFSVFLDSANITVGRTIVFGLELTVSSTDYEIDGLLFFDQRIEGEYLFRNTLTIRATRDGDDWNIRYNLSDDTWSESRGRKVETDEKGLFIPVSSAKGFEGRLRLMPRSWS